MDLSPTVIRIMENMNLDDDIRQDLYVLWLEAEDERQEFDSTVHLGSYIAGWYRNMKRNNHKIEANRRRLEVVHYDELADLHYGGSSVNTPEEMMELQEDMAARIGGLSDSMMDVMQEYYVEGKTDEEIAETRGTTEGAVRVLRHRGSKILKGVLQ